MSKAAIVLTIGLIISHISFASAEESRLSGGDLELKLLTIKNPFESKLPKKKEPEPLVADHRPKLLPEQHKPVIAPKPPIQTIETRKPKITEKIKEIIPKFKIPVPPVNITGIIWNSDRPQAIINGQIVDIGDTILDLTITDIQKSSIQATFHGQSVTIKTQRSQL